MLTSFVLLFPDGYRKRSEPVVGAFSVEQFDEVNQAALPTALGPIASGSSVLVRGWTFDALRGCPAATVLVEWAGSVAEAEYGEERPDVAEQFPALKLARVGFRCVLGPPPGTLGESRIRVFSVSADGAEITALPGSCDITVVRGDVPIEFRGSRRPGFADIGIDVWCAGSRLLDASDPTVEQGEDVVVSGWAVDRAASRAVSGAFAVVDDTDVLRGYVGAARPDVAAALGKPAVVGCGYRLRIPTASLSPTRHRVAIGVVNAAGDAYDLVEIAHGLRILPPAT